MNYMWWLEKEKPETNTFLDNRIYQNMVSVFKQVKPILSSSPYISQELPGARVDYYYNSIPYLDKTYDVVYIPTTPTVGYASKIYFANPISQYQQMSGKYVFSIQVVKEGVDKHMDICIIYDDEALLCSHLQFLFACVKDYESMMVDERIKISKEIQKYTKDKIYNPEALKKSPAQFFKPKKRPRITSYAPTKTIKIHTKRGQDGKFLPKEARD